MKLGLVREIFVEFSILTNRRKHIISRPATSLQRISNWNFHHSRGFHILYRDSSRDCLALVEVGRWCEIFAPYGCRTMESLLDWIRVSCWGPADEVYRQVEERQAEPKRERRQLGSSKDSSLLRSSDSPEPRGFLRIVTGQVTVRNYETHSALRSLQSTTLARYFQERWKKKK